MNNGVFELNSGDIEKDLREMHGNERTDHLKETVGEDAVEFRLVHATYIYIWYICKYSAHAITF